MSCSAYCETMGMSNANRDEPCYMLSKTITRNFHHGVLRKANEPLSDFTIGNEDDAFNDAAPTPKYLQTKPHNNLIGPEL